MTNRLREDEQSRTYGSSFAEILDGLFTDEDATAHLNAMNQMGPNPWPLSFSYGRAMQSAALKLWSQDIVNNVAKAQATVHARARANGLAALGKWEG